MKKENYFGSTKINVVRKSLKKSLVVSDMYGNAELNVCDGEIKDRDDSAPVVVLTITEDEKEKTLLIHKLDCLALATFLLEIHNEYATEQNEIRFQEQQDMLNMKNNTSTKINLNS